MAPIIINSTVAFEQGDTFVFGSWVCIADGAGCFLRFLAQTLELKPTSTTLPQASMDDLAENFGEISLSDPIRELESESEYNSTSTQAWIEPRELAPESSSCPVYLPQPLLFGHRSTGAPYQATLSKLKRLCKEAMSEYFSDSVLTPDYYSDSYEYEFGYGSDSSEEKLLVGPT